MQYIGRLDRNKLGIYKNKILTDEVILTEERIKHIKERHPRWLWELYRVYKRYNKKSRFYFGGYKKYRYNNIIKKN